MKRKKEPVAPVPPAGPGALAPPGKKALPPAVITVPFGIVLFFAMTVQTLPMAVVLLVLGTVSLAAGAALGRLSTWQTVPAAGLLALSVIRGAAAIYSPFDESALREYCKFAAAAALAAAVLSLCRRRHVRGIVWDLAGVSAAVSWLSADLAAAAKVFTPFNGLMQALGTDYTNLLERAGDVRVNGLYNDSNVTAALFSLGAIAAVYLLRSAGRWWARLAAGVLAGVNLVGLVISGSRGAMLCFAAACVVYLFLQRQDRLGLFLLLVQAAASTLACALPCTRLLSQGDPRALWALGLCGVVLFGLDALLTRPLSALMRRRPRIAAALGGAVAALALAAMAVLLTADGPVHFTEQSTTWRRLLPETPGTYTLSGDWDGDIQALVYSRTPLELLRSTSTTLYSGPLEGCSYTVAEDATEVYIRLVGAPGDTLRRLTLPDGRDLRLRYRLLPSAIANRLLGDKLLGGNSFLMRLEYDKDAWRLFMRSPLLGHGLGSTEHLYRSVQTFAYESKYVHNHLLQTLSDTGLLGLAGALAFVLGSAFLSLRAAWRDRDGLGAALLSAWVMMHLHSLMEISFSIQGFACFAYVLMALPLAAWEAPAARTGAVRWARRLLPGALGVYFALFAGLLISHEQVQRAAEETGFSNADEMLQALEGYIRRDVFTPAHFQLTYAANAALVQNSRYNGTMLRCVRDLERTGTYENCSGLAQYYYLPRQEWEALFAASRKGIRQVRSSPDGWNLQMTFYREQVLAAMGQENVTVFLSGVLALGDDLEAMNAEGRLEEVSLSPENQEFLALCRQLSQHGADSETAFAQLTEAVAAAAQPAA